MIQRYIIGPKHRFDDVHEFTARVGLVPIGLKSQVFPGRNEPAEVVFGVDEVHPEIRFSMRVDPVRRVVEFIGDHAEDLSRAFAAHFDVMTREAVRARSSSDVPEDARLAAWQLADFGGEDERLLLESMLESVCDDYVLDGVLRAIEFIGSRASVPVLRTFSENESKPLQARWLSREIAGALDVHD